MPETKVIMPQMGESIFEGTITKWLKKPGEHVERDEPLFEISTDKVDTEIPSPAAGTLSEVLVEEGKTVGINTVVARISDGAAAPAAEPAKPAAQAPPPPPEPVKAAPAAQAPPPPAPPAAPPQEPGESAAPLSPLVRRMAKENNIDLSRVKGTGAGGRITKQDVEAHLGQPAAAAQAPPKVEQPQPLSPAPAAAPTQPQAPGQAKVRIEPMSPMR